MNKKRYKKTIIFDKEMEDFVKENINKSKKHKFHKSTQRKSYYKIQKLLDSFIK